MTIEAPRRQEYQDLRSKPLNDRLKPDLISRTAALLELNGSIIPSLRILSNNVGDEGSIIYMRNKKKFGEEVDISVGIDLWTPEGFNTESLNLGSRDGIHFYTPTAVNGLIAMIKHYNDREDIHGVMVQLPLLNRRDTDAVIDAIDPEKDVDGLRRDSKFLAATPSGAIELLQEYGFNYVDSEVAVVGAESETLGEPFIRYRHAVRGNDDGLYAIEKDTSKGARIDAFNRSDIIISAAPVSDVIDEELLAERLSSNRPLAIIDASGKSVSQRVRENAPPWWYLTPKIGGLGPATIRMLVGNTVLAAERTAGIDTFAPILGGRATRNVIPFRRKPRGAQTLPSMPYSRATLDKAA